MDQLVATVEGLWNEFAGDQDALNRLRRHVTEVLPMTMRTEVSLLRERRRSIEQADYEKTDFTRRFLTKHQFYFCPRSETFVHYDGKNYLPYLEDNVLHTVLSAISGHETLKPIKHKLKAEIMEKIRKRSPFGSLPESETIQSVMGFLHPAFFPSRDAAKYFLTVVGDCIMSKKSDIFFIGTSALRGLMRRVEDELHMHFGMTGALAPIKLKYYDHPYDKCRLLPVPSGAVVPKDQEVGNRCLDLLCVAAHYSVRYGGSEVFLSECTNAPFVDKVRFAIGKTAESLVADFASSWLTKTDNASMSEANAVFVWKRYLDSCGVPDVIFRNTLINSLKGMFIYDADTKHFTNMTSVHLPALSAFTRFWNETMKESECAFDEVEPGYEIDEVVSMFRDWNGKRLDSISPELAIDIIADLHPEHLIKERRIITGVVSSQWDKKAEVHSVLSDIANTDKENSPLGLADAYHNYAAARQPRRVMSKTCFTLLARDLAKGCLYEGDMFNDSFWN